MKKQPSVIDQAEANDTDRWLLSYADFITLLFAFFVVLYAISSVDARKFDRISQGMKSAFVDAPNGAQPILVELGLAERGGAADADIEVSNQQLDGESGEGTQLGLLQDRVERAIGTVMDPNAIEAPVRVARSNRGLVISLAANDFFEPGSSRISEAQIPTLDAISGVLRKIHSPVRIEGHTDDQPIRSRRYPSNWELSTQRATAVVRWLIETANIPAERLAAAGFADVRPLVPNLSEKNRAINRRVEIVILAPLEDPNIQASKRRDAELNDLIRRLPSQLPGVNPDSNSP